jgi:hypothetical protein
MPDRCCLCGWDKEKDDVRWHRFFEHMMCRVCRNNWRGRDTGGLNPIYCQKEGHNGVVGRTTGPS